MSLQSELTRLQANVASVSSSKDDIMTALASKGVTVPAGATLHDVPNLIGQINGMAPSNLVTIGGRTYKTVKIGTQEWLAENLDWKAPGITILNSSSAPLTAAACYYNYNEPDYGIDGTYGFGLLYNWYCCSIISSLLPTGWRIATESDFEILKSLDIGSNAIHLKKEVSWDDTWIGDNSIGFSAIPGHSRSEQGDFITSSAVLYWTINSQDNNKANSYYINLLELGNWYNFKPAMGYIRLVKDAT